MTRRLAPAVAAVLALALGACGVPRDDEPQLVNDREVPFGLLDTTTSTAPTAPVTVAG